MHFVDSAYHITIGQRFLVFLLLDCWQCILWRGLPDVAVTSSLQDLRYKAPSRALVLQMQFICTLITDRIAKMFATKKTTNLVKLMNQVREVGQLWIFCRSNFMLPQKRKRSKILQKMDQCVTLWHCDTVTLCQRCQSWMKTVSTLCNSFDITEEVHLEMYVLSLFTTSTQNSDWHLSY